MSRHESVVSVPQDAAASVQRRFGEVAKFPPWALFATLVAGSALSAAALIDDQAIALGVALVGMLFVGLLVVYKPHLGVFVIMSTMLMSYPRRCAAWGR